MRLVVAICVALLGVRTADACGFWSMTDKPKGLTIGWLINSASIEKGDKRWAALYLDLDDPHGLRVAQGKKVVYDIKGDVVRRYGKAIGKRTADGVTFNSHAYAIALTAPKNDHGMWSFTLAVTLDGDTILESDAAASLCAGIRRKDFTQADGEEEVRRRVIYYLAWRETGF